MELRLYKEPYQEPFSERRLRLLFEGAVDFGGEARTRRDLYLYVWIENRRELSGFQAVLDEEYVLDFHAPAKLEFSRIGSRPVKRSLSRPLTARERQDFQNCLRGMSNPVFPELVRNLEKIARGETGGAFELTKEESTTLDGLARLSSGVPK